MDCKSVSAFALGSRNEFEHILERWMYKSNAIMLVISMNALPIANPIYPN